MRHANSKYSSTTNYWDRKEGESAQAFTAFRTYLEMGQERSIRAAYCAHSGKKDASQASGRWKKWAKQFDWEWRARDYDLHMERVKQQAAEKEAAEKERQWFRRKDESREHGWQLGNQLLAKAEQMLKFPLLAQESDQVVEKRLHSDGTEYEVVINRTIIKPTEWNFLSMVRMAEAGYKLIQLAVGLPTEHTAIAAPAGESDGKISQEESDARLLELLERARARAEAAKKDDPENIN